MTKHKREKKPNTTDLPMSECSQVCNGVRDESVLDTMILRWGKVVNGIKNGADGGDDVGWVETEP